MHYSKREQIIELIKRRKIIRAGEVDQLGISRTYLNALLQEGVLERPTRGIYVLAKDTLSENRSIAEIAARVPHGIICLLSALQYHALTTQAPFEVWLMINKSARHPKIDYPPVRILRSTGSALEYGIERHQIDGIDVRIYSPAKTVADCFKYRNKIGLDIALEALRDCYRQKRASLDEIWTAAKSCRMTNVMRPYLESLT